MSHGTSEEELSEGAGLPALIRRAREGDRGALEALLGRSRDRLRTLCPKFGTADLKPLVTESDLVQRTLGEMYRSFTGFRGDDASSLDAWVRAILRREIHASRRRAAAEQRRRDAAAEAPAKAQLTPSGAFEQARRMQRVVEAFNELRQPERHLITRRDIEDAGYDEIARELKISPETARMRVYRARQALRTFLDSGDESFR